MYSDPLAPADISMRSLLITVFSIFAVTTWADNASQPRISKPGAHSERLQNNPLYADYVYRQRQRYHDALATRRRINATRPPAVYYRYNPNAMSPFWSAIQAGWVRQPPIPRPRRDYVIYFDADPIVRSFSD